jgi:hypothetical protein
MVRQRMITPGYSLLRTILLIAAIAVFASCNPTEIASTGRSNLVSNSDGHLDGSAYVFKENPYILTGGSATPGLYNISKAVTGDPELITENTSLTGNCSLDLFFSFSIYNQQLNDCIRSFGQETDTQAVSRNADRMFVFPTGSEEFYNTNTLYHLQLAKKTYLDKIKFAYDKIFSLSSSIPKSIPNYLRNSGHFWFKGITSTNSRELRNSYLTSYSFCDLESNAAFRPADTSLCFGAFSKFDNTFIVQDPSVIYHEFMHAIVSIMMNYRNGTSSVSHPFRSSLGKFGYDEAFAINEGLADYFSFVMTKRTHFGEWALGKTSNASRPMSERDPAHIPALDTSSEGRLAYPTYVLYNPNDPDKPIEDEHYAGMIVSHYLTALTESFKTECGLSSEADEGHDKATSYVMLLIAETLAELGDLNAKGVDEFASPHFSSLFFNNLDYTNSYLWAHVVNQPNFRRFFQVFGKNINKYITPSICPAFTRTESEKLLDDYGLLLFKTYNNNGNSTKDRTKVYKDAVSTIGTQTLVTVSEDNRRKSVLVSKQLLDTASAASPTAVNFYLIDTRKDVNDILSLLLFKGLAVPLSPNVSSTDYNNGNVRISPGEIVGVIPNLYNGSNTAMAGVQLLASDWDHVHITDTTTGNFKPCVLDSVTTVDQGGEAGLSCVNGSGYTYPDKDYDRLYKRCPTSAACTESQKVFPSQAAAPVCLVQLDEGDSTRWVSQNEFRKKNGLSLQDKDCLGYSTSGVTDKDFTFNPHECMARFLPGANDAFFSKIEPRKNFYQTAVLPSEGQRFNVGNLMLLEVSKWVPPGTKFRCRMRARFSNCSDCYTDAANGNDDYLDYELNGHKPYKIINFEFDVND